MEAIKLILRLLRGTPDLLITYNQSSNLEVIAFSNASYGTDNSEKAKSTSGHIHFLCGELSTSAPAFSTTIGGALLLAG